MTDSIIEAIDAQITTLQKVRALLAGTTDVLSGLTKAKRGRPKGSKNVTTEIPLKPKRVMTEEGRARISAAVKKRHAARKRAAKKTAAQGEQEQAA